MSDYQHVEVLKKKGKVVTLAVLEDVPDVGALYVILDGKGRLKGRKADAIKLAAILLLDEKARVQEVMPPSDDTPSPEDFVAGVTVVSAEPIGKDPNGRTRWRATLELTLTEARFAKPFSVGEQWGAAADVGVDFDDLFS